MTRPQVGMLMGSLSDKPVLEAAAGILAEFGVEHVDMPATPERVWSLMQGGSS